MSANCVRKRVLTSEEALQFQKRKESLVEENQKFVTFLSEIGLEAVQKGDILIPGGSTVISNCTGDRKPAVSGGVEVVIEDGEAYFVKCTIECCEWCGTECENQCFVECENVCDPQCVECPPECSGVCNPECSGVWNDLNFGDCQVMDIGPNIVGTGQITIIESIGGGKLRFCISHQ